MSKGTMQRVTILGRLGNDPEVRDSKGDNLVVKLNLATTDRVKRKDSGNWEDATTWHYVTAFGQLAEFSKNYLKKGDSVLIEAKLRPSKWEDKDGKEHYSIDIIANELQQVGKSTRPESEELNHATTLEDVE